MWKISAAAQESERRGRSTIEACILMDTDQMDEEG